MTAFTTNARRSLTAQQKAKLFLDRGGRCHRCKRRLGPSDKWTVEHFQALQNGGTNEWSNLAVCCAWCFQPKNAEDAKKAAKTRAVATKHVVPKSERRSPRGFRGWRRFDGSLVFRDGRRFDGA